MILPDQVNLVDVAYLQHQQQDELERQSRIIKARELEEGFFDQTLAADVMDAMIGGTADDLEGINLLSIAINTVKRRVSYGSVTATDDEEQTTWFQNLLKYGRLLKIQRDIHRWLIRDGIAFLIVDYDVTKAQRWEDGGLGMPIFYPHEAFTSVEASWNGFIGSNEGCKAHWRNNNPNRPLDMVSKRWTEMVYENGELVATQRMTLYIAEQAKTPARLEKYKMGNNGWEQTKDRKFDADGNEIDEGWPVWWTDTGDENGNSLPLPVVVFRNEDNAPSFKRAWGMQFGMDQLWGSFLSASNMTGHQLLVALGFYPTTDGKPLADDKSNALKIKPRTVVGTTRSKTDADLKAIDGGNISAITDGLDKTAMFFALIAGLPLKNFTFSRQVSSAEALRHGEVELIAQANELIDLNEPNWESVFELARMMDNQFGDGNWGMSQINIHWQPAETVSGDKKLTEIQGKQSVGVPNDQIMRDTLNYSEAEINSFGEGVENGEEETQATEEA